jgi:hypothetical protein
MRAIALITDGPTVRGILANCGEPAAHRARPRPPLWEPPVAGAGGGNSPAEPAPEYEFDQRIAW